MRLAFLIGLATLVASISATPTFAASTAFSPRLIEAYGRVPIAFEPNRGQADPAVQYLARGSGYTVLLTADEAVLALQRGGRSFVSEMRFGGGHSGALQP
jgi:hypothetical protein